MIDLAKQEVTQAINYKTDDIEWFGEEGGRGLRGIAFDGETVYIAASNRLLKYDKRFKLIDSWQHPYLANAFGICIHQRILFIACAGNDCILAFDLDEKKFHWAMHVQSEHFQFRPAIFDPQGSDGPIPINKLQLRTIWCDEGGMYFSGHNTGGLLHFNGHEIKMRAELPRGAQDAQPFRKGIIFNDSHAGVLRYCGDNDGSEDRALQVPFFNESDHSHMDSVETHMLKRGYGRGLCTLSEKIVAGGSTPAGVSVYDLRNNKKLASIWFTKNVRLAVNSVQVWQE